MADFAMQFCFVTERVNEPSRKHNYMGECHHQTYILSHVYLPNLF